VTGYVDWEDIRGKCVEEAGGEATFEAGKQELLMTVVGHRLGELRKARGFTQREVANRMGVTKGRISQIGQGQISGQDVIARYACALGGRLHQTIHFGNGEVFAIA